MVEISQLVPTLAKYLDTLLEFSVTQISRFFFQKKKILTKIICKHDFNLNNVLFVSLANVMKNFLVKKKSTIFIYDIKIDFDMPQFRLPNFSSKS